MGDLWDTGNALATKWAHLSTFLKMVGGFFTSVSVEAHSSLSILNRVTRYQTDYSESLITSNRVVNSSQHLNYPSLWEQESGCDITSKRSRERDKHWAFPLCAVCLKHCSPSVVYHTCGVRDHYLTDWKQPLHEGLSLMTLLFKI